MAEGPNLSCRMYEAQYPAVDDIVMVKIRELQENGAYVDLLEYNNAQGMIMLTEVSRRRIRSINKHLRVGSVEVCSVVRVDEDKGYIDVSKRRVAAEDKPTMDEKYSKSKSVHSMMRHVAEVNRVDLQDLYERWGWKLYENFGHAYEAFRIVVSDESVLNGLDITDAEKTELLKVIKRKMSPHAVRLRADVDVSCFEVEGVDAIKKALLKGEEAGTGDIPVKITLLAPPLYICSAQALSKAEGIAVLEKCLEAIKESILASGGIFKVSQPPRTVSEKDEKQLSSLMGQLEEQNEDEVEGSSDEDDDNTER